MGAPFIFPESPSLKAARLLHDRRQLCDALEWGLAMLDAFDLSPLALDIMDEKIAMLDAIEAPLVDLEPSLGAPEHGMVLGGRLHRYLGRRFVDNVCSQTRWSGGNLADLEQEGLEEEDDPGEDDGTAEPGGDAEETLGWAANVRQVLLGPNTADGDVTAPERHGRGFVRCAGDDHEDDFIDAPDVDDPLWSTTMPPRGTEVAHA